MSSFRGTLSMSFCRAKDRRAWAIDAFAPHFCLPLLVGRKALLRLLFPFDSALVLEFRPQQQLVEVRSELAQHLVPGLLMNLPQHTMRGGNPRLTSWA